VKRIVAYTACHADVSYLPAFFFALNLESPSTVCVTVSIPWIPRTADATCVSFAPVEHLARDNVPSPVTLLFGDCQLSIYQSLFHLRSIQFLDQKKFSCGITMLNVTFIQESPPLPPFTFKPAPSLIKDVPDLYLTLALPVIAYWGWGLMFFAFDTFNYFEHYRLHTPAEIRKRNLVPISSVVRCVLIQQSWQIALGLWFYSGPELTGQEDYNIAVWATRVRLVQRYVPSVFTAVGIDAVASARRIYPIFPAFAGFLSGGGKFFDASSDLNAPQDAKPTHLAWEIVLAKLIYHVVVPALQFGTAVFIGDAWQFWLHWASHQNSWIFSTNRPTQCWACTNGKIR
jgi:hypothetical protein